MNHNEILEAAYDEAVERMANGNYEIQLEDDLIKDIRIVVERSESNKGMIAVLTTLLAHKIYNPNQDIRYHQAQQENGFAGRGIDQQYITPFMKQKNFPSMSESGWLTRSLEQPHPYTLDYPGNIRPERIKKAFLEIIDYVQVQNEDARRILTYYFALLIKQRDSMNIDMAKPHSLSIATIIEYLKKHFTYKYSCAGASRLPTLAIYAAYQCMMKQVSRYSNKKLLPLESHNSSDTQSGRIGDIEIDNENNTAFEGVEIKHEMQITPQLVRDAYEKFKVYNTDRYYLLTTANMDAADWGAIENEIQRIRDLHGCQVIVNGVYSSLKYYLRLLSDPAEFVDNYVELLKVDDTVKYQHKSVWNDIISGNI